MTNVTRMKTGAIADAFGALKAEMAELAKRERLLKAALEARMAMTNKNTVEGDLFRVTRAEVSRDTLDSAAVKALLSADALAAVTKTSTSTRFTVSARVANERKAAA